MLYVKNQTKTELSVMILNIRIMSLRELMEKRGISPTTMDRLESEKIDVEVIHQMDEEDLIEYLPCKGDRVAIKAYATKIQNHTDGQKKKKISLIQNIKNRMKLSHFKSIDTDDEDQKSLCENLKRKNTRGMRSFRAKQTSITQMQAQIASKDDKALVVGFCILDDNMKYRQVRSPMGGGIRHPRVNKDTTKMELVVIIRSLFFPDGRNVHGAIEDFDYDISTDVHGTQLMRAGETVDGIIKRLGLKHLRCYLLAKAYDTNDEDLPKITRSKRTPTTENALLEEKSDTSDNEENFPKMTRSKRTPTTENALVEDKSDTYDNEGNLQKMTRSKRTPSTDNTSVGEKSDTFDSEIVDSQESNVPNVIVEFIPQLEYHAYDLSNVGISDPANIIAMAAEDSGIIEFGRLPPDDTELDATLPLAPIQEIAVHRGLVCRDLIAFFSQDQPDAKKEKARYEIKMLKADGTEEIAEDNGGVMRDALSEFWDTFYMQFTEGNSYKVPVIRHDMREVHWRAVASVIKMGFTQEGVFPIKLAPSFMQQAIFGICHDSEIIESFLEFVPAMDKTVFEAALKDFYSVKDDILDVMENYDVKTLVNEGNVSKVVHEIAHKELIQKPMFVSDSFHKVLQNSKLVGEDMRSMYSSLKPNPKKVLNALTFPTDMSPDDMRLSSYLKKLVREMDDNHYLQLFLRFCTGSDIMTAKKIHVRFTASDTSSYVRSPSAHTCGCVLELPRSYAQDPFVVLKADFLELLKNRYWQMDIV
ncbi:hypothetical protein KUTeg_015211 [Tegillarca granosa]|uniref:HECT domain-containing protein n=1 Tax=Tegillarca granosa TaxID=220873 RepID=A0ABQ9ET41_TEGGR|nr:hypothetical protein KUTeg_015211 [Tegillarca granosa]